MTSAEAISSLGDVNSFSILETDAQAAASPVIEPTADQLGDPDPLPKHIYKALRATEKGAEKFGEIVGKNILTAEPEHGEAIQDIEADMQSKGLTPREIRIAKIAALSVRPEAPSIQYFEASRRERVARTFSQVFRRIVN